MNGPTSIQSQSPDWRYTHTHNSTKPPVSPSDISSSYRSTSDVKTHAPLPPLANLDIAKIRRDAQENSNDSKHASPVTYSTPSAMSLNSPMSGYPGPPPPYSSCVATPTVAATGGHTDYQPRPMGEPQRVQEEEEQQRSRPQLPSLPSIHEALGKDPSAFYQGPPHPPAVASARPPSLSTISPTTPIQPFHTNSFSSLNSYKPQPSGSSNPPPRPVLDTFRTASQPIDVQRYGAEPQSASTVLTSPHTTNTTRSQPQSHPTTPAFFKPINTQHPPPGQASQSHTTPYPPAYSYPPPSSYPNQVSPSESWRGEDFASRRDYKRPQDARPSSPRAQQSSNDNKPNPGPYNHGESVKRHLETFDLELGLNEIAEASSRTLDFARKYVDKAHNMHRSGIETALPTLTECDDMQHLQRSILNAMERIRDIVVTQQHALAEQRSREEANKARQTMYQEQTMYNKDEGSGGFAGADPKKRRGRHAPPGRCHSCARSETPEWRRGPDGARTLCNACGLHYAKLTRKLGPKASLPSSNLRPKDNADPTT